MGDVQLLEPGQSPQRLEAVNPAGAEPKRLQGALAGKRLDIVDPGAAQVDFAQPVETGKGRQIPDRIFGKHQDFEVAKRAQRSKIERAGAWTAVRIGISEPELAEIFESPDLFQVGQVDVHRAELFGVQRKRFPSQSHFVGLVYSHGQAKSRVKARFDSW